MHLAAGVGNSDQARCLSEKGADVNIKDDWGVSEWDNCSLHISICYCPRRMVVTF